MAEKTSSEPKLTIKVNRAADRITDRIVVMEIHGELTRLAEKPLDAAYAEAVSLGAKTIVLECSNLTYMNHKGVSLLVKLVATAQREGQRLAAVGLSDHYRRVFQISGLDDGITVFADIVQVRG